MEKTREAQISYIESTHGSIKKIVKYLYGERIIAKINIFSKLRTSLSKKLSDLAFLKLQG